MKDTELDVAVLKSEMKTVNKKLDDMAGSIKEILDYQKDTNGKTNKAIDWIENFEKEGYKKTIKDNATSRVKLVTIVTAIVTLAGLGGMTIIKLSAEKILDNYFEDKLPELTAQVENGVVENILKHLENYELEIVE